MPTRADLVSTSARLAAAGCRSVGQDHLLGLSLYLTDPDGNTIEITHLTPDRGTITVVGGRFLGMTTEGQPHSILDPLDPVALRGGLTADDPGAATLPPGTINGHIHFRSRDLGRGFDFYSRVLGLMPNLFAPVSGFCDLGRADHPHLVALNTWAGDRLTAAPSDAAGMIACTLLLPALGAVADRLRDEGGAFERHPWGLACADPDGNLLHLHAA